MNNVCREMIVANKDCMLEDKIGALGVRIKRCVTLHGVGPAGCFASALLLHGNLTAALAPLPRLPCIPCHAGKRHEPEPQGLSARSHALCAPPA
jgi:hypothetical protein